MITYKQMNMFEDNVDAIVNTVNCMGVMGSGLAYQFKRRYQDYYVDYWKKCDRHEIKVGTVDVYTVQCHPEKVMGWVKYIISFPTKEDWRNPSRLEYIRDGLDSLVSVVKQYNIKSIGIPPLGCGLGGLKWEDVKPLIEDKVSQLDGIDVHIYLPTEE